MSEERRRALLADAEANDRIIIEDGYDSQLVDEAPQQALKSVDPHGPRHLCRVDVQNPGARFAARLHRRARAAWWPNCVRCAASLLRHPPANNQRAVALFLSLGHHEALVRRLSSSFQERRDRLISELRVQMPEWKITRTSGGTSVWLEGPARAPTHGRSAEAAALRGVVAQAGDRLFRPARRRCAVPASRHLVDPAQPYRTGNPRAGGGQRPPLRGCLVAAKFREPPAIGRCADVGDLPAILVHQAPNDGLICTEIREAGPSLRPVRRRLPG